MDLDHVRIPPDGTTDKRESQPQSSNAEEQDAGNGTGDDPNR